MEILDVGTDAEEADELRFYYAFECVFGVVAGFMEKGMSVCGFEINFGLKGCVVSVGGSEGDCGVQEIDVSCACCMLNFYCWVMVIEDVYELCECGWMMGPDTKDVIEVSEVECGFEGAFF